MPSCYVMNMLYFISSWDINSTISSDHVCFSTIHLKWTVCMHCTATYSSFCCVMQTELQEAKEDLNEKTQLLETRDAELKMLHTKLLDSGEQMKNELQKKKAEWNDLREIYHKVHRSFFTFSTILLCAHWYVHWTNHKRCWMRKTSWLEKKLTWRYMQFKMQHCMSVRMHLHTFHILLLITVWHCRITMKFLWKLQDFNTLLPFGTYIGGLGRC